MFTVVAKKQQMIQDCLFAFSVVLIRSEIVFVSQAEEKCHQISFLG